MRTLEISGTDRRLGDVVDEYVRTGEEVILKREGRPVARLTMPPISEGQARREDVDIVEIFRNIRERIRSDWPDEPDFDWKAEMEEGRA